MKRVLIVSSSFWPDNRMGAVRPTKLAKYLERMGYTVTVITTTPDGTFDRTSVLNVENGTRVFRVHRGCFLIRYLAGCAIEWLGRDQLPRIWFKRSKVHYRVLDQVS